MNKIVLERTIDNLSKLIEITDEQKKSLFERYSEKEDKDLIKDLAQSAYELLRDNEELYTKTLELLRNVNPEICPPIEDMKAKLNKSFSNEVEGNMSVEDNHKLVNETIVNFTKLFNKYGIDYYIVGALPCFLKTGQPLFRYHDDIDIMINEDDIPTIAEIIERTGYEFHDDRFPSLERFHEMEDDKPPHTVLAQNPDNEFHVGFFTFRREPDKSITMREYSHRLENGEVAVDVLERRSDPRGTELRYDETPVEYMGTSFRTSTPESVYALKQYTKRPKDITDTQKLEPYIDKAKLEELHMFPNEQVEIKNIQKKTNQLKR